MPSARATGIEPRVRASEVAPRQNGQFKKGSSIGPPGRKKPRVAILANCQSSRLPTCDERRRVFSTRVNQKGRSKISSRRDEARINYSLAVETGARIFPGPFAGWGDSRLSPSSRSFFEFITERNISSKVYRTRAASPRPGRRAPPSIASPERTSRPKQYNRSLRRLSLGKVCGC